MAEYDSRDENRTRSFRLAAVAKPARSRKKAEAAAAETTEPEPAKTPRAAARDTWRPVLVGMGGALAAFFVFGGLRGLVKTAVSDPFDTIPRESFIAATVDFEELRRSPIYEAVFGKDGRDGKESGHDPLRRALGVSALSEACGFDPMARVQRFAVAVPEAGERGEFGVAARVEVTRDELEKCTRSLAEKRGEHAETHDVGSFVVLEAEHAGESAKPDQQGMAAGRPRLAYGRGGLLVVGRGTWFDAMLGAAEHVKPGLREAPEHIALRSSLTGHDGFHAPTLLATAILPRALREKLKAEMGGETDGREPDTSSVIMAGVLGVSAVGIAIHAGGSGQNVDASIELVCDSDEACEAVEKLAQKKRKDWSSDLTLRIVGLGPVLDSFQLERKGSRLRATANAPADTLASTIERIIKLRSRQAPPSGRPQLPQPAGPRKPFGLTDRPDETLPARDAGPRQTNPGP
jgi:hypothetical protein